MGIEGKDYSKTISGLLWFVIFALGTEIAVRRISRRVTKPTTYAEDQKPITEEVAINALQNVPLLGQLASAIWYSQNPIPIVQTGQDLIEGLSSLVKGKSKETKIRGGIRATSAAGSLGGVTGISQAAQFLLEFFQDKKPVKLSD